MKKNCLAIAALTLAAGAPVALAQDALLYINGAHESYSRTAATSAGFSVTEVFDEATFIAEMGAGSYDIAIYENPSAGNTPGLAAAVDGFIAGGGKAHFCYWNVDVDPALQASFDIASATDIFIAEAIHDNAGHGSWGGATSPVAVAPIADPWNDNGDYMTPNGDGEIVATHASGNGATIVGNAGQSLFNGWEYDTKDGAGVLALLQSQMEWLISGAVAENALVLDWDTEDHVGADATAAAGLNPLVTIDGASFEAALPTTAWRMVTIDNPSNTLAASTSDALADYIDGGGRVHMSYWNLDADPTLQTAFGVASATDFLDPRPVFATAPTHASWGGLTTVPVDPAPSPWLDNGDTLTVGFDCAPGASEVIGEFDSAGSGEGAIVTARARTLANGFDYDSMDTARVLDLVTNQIRWLRSAEVDPSGGPTGCYADCDDSGTLDFFDFLCYQNLFAAESCDADCDESGALDFFDFLCFQNAFAAGCPDLEHIDLGIDAPPSSMCGATMTPFPLDGRPLSTDVTDVPSPLGGNVTFDIACNHRRIGLGWASWSHGYTGDVYYTNGSAVLNMGIPANSAFYFYVEPNPFVGFDLEVTARGGGAEIVTGPIFVLGQAGAHGFGYCGGVEEITVEWVDGGGGLMDFSVGEFGIAN